MENKNALIIGAAGFVGGYLAEELKNKGYCVTVTKLACESYTGVCDAAVDLDVTDAEAVAAVIRNTRPGAVYHLAAQSSVAVSWEKPALTVDINVKGAVNLLEACRREAEQAVVLLIGSAEEYGKLSPEQCPVSEAQVPCPKNVYAMTKTAQNMLGRLYYEAYGMRVRMVRAFNHIGPKQAPRFVISDFCRQVAEIEAGKREPVMKVGNLEAKRDFTDVRDIVQAYVMLAEGGRDGETYNVGSGRAVSIQEMLDCILGSSKAEIRVEQDPARLRPSDVPIYYADISKISSETGWLPQIDRKETVESILDYWRENL